MNHRYIIAGIGTDVGKTVVSAILAEALRADYWKPVQAGDLNQSDSMRVKEWTELVTIIPEAYRLTQALSPHAASSIDEVKIKLTDLSLPHTDNNLIVECAGGIMVPVNNEGHTILDAIRMWDLPVILVSRHYLGSINHSLMTAEILKQHKVKVGGFVFVGDENSASEKIILSISGFPMITRIPLVDEVSKTFISAQAKRLVADRIVESLNPNTI